MILVPFALWPLIVIGPVQCVSRCLKLIFYYWSHQVLYNIVLFPKCIPFQSASFNLSPSLSTRNTFDGKHSIEPYQIGSWKCLFSVEPIMLVVVIKGHFWFKTEQTLFIGRSSTIDVQRQVVSLVMVSAWFSVSFVHSFVFPYALTHHTVYDYFVRISWFGWFY